MGPFYLGLKKGIDREAMAGELRASPRRWAPFVPETYVNKFSCQEARSLPDSSWNDSLFGKKQAWCSKSARLPYIFTFKLWDGGGSASMACRGRFILIMESQHRLGRQTDWVQRNLINRSSFFLGKRRRLDEERTGAARTGIYWTRRNWFTGKTPLDTQGTVNVLILWRAGSNRRKSEGRILIRL